MAVPAPRQRKRPKRLGKRVEGSGCCGGKGAPARFVGFFLFGGGKGGSFIIR